MCINESKGINKAENFEISTNKRQLLNGSLNGKWEKMKKKFQLRDGNEHFFKQPFFGIHLMRASTREDYFALQTLFWNESYVK